MKLVKLFVLASCLCAGLAVQADYLHWQVGNTSGSGITGTYTGARLVAKNGDREVALSLIDAWAEEEGFDSSTDGYAVKNNSGDLYAVLDNSLLQSGEEWSDYSFFVELVNWDFGDHSGIGDSYVKGTSDTISYSDVSGSITGELSLDPSGAWQGTGYAVPEPTSGLLVMIGLGLAGLRRRRNAVA